MGSTSRPLPGRAGRQNCAVDCRYHKPPGASAMLRKATPPGCAVVMRMCY